MVDVPLLVMAIIARANPDLIPNWIANKQKSSPTITKRIHPVLEEFLGISSGASLMTKSISTTTNALFDLCNRTQKMPFKITKDPLTCHTNIGR